MSRDDSPLADRHGTATYKTYKFFKLTKKAKKLQSNR